MTPEPTCGAPIKTSDGTVVATEASIPDGEPRQW